MQSVPKGNISDIPQLFYHTSLLHSLFATILVFRLRIGFWMRGGRGDGACGGGEFRGVGSRGVGMFNNTSKNEF